MQVVLILLSIQGVLGAFDNFWNHELKERLPSKPSARIELALHAARQVIYAFFFAAIAWRRWEGGYALLLAGVLAVEAIITLWDFVEEDRSRKLSALERVTHGLLTLNYGAVIGLLGIELAAWAARPTAVAPADHGTFSWLLTIYAGGVLVCALRDAIACWRLGRLPSWQQRPLTVGHALRPMNVLVAGGTGFVGETLCRRLIADGHRVIVLTRDRRKAEDRFGPHAEALETLDDLPQNQPVDVVVNLAGAPVVAGPWTRARRRTLLESRLKPTQELVDWMERRMIRPQAMISASAIGFYGEGGAERLTEQSPASSGFMSGLCIAWERIAGQAETLGVRVVKLRTGIVLGRGGGMLAALRLVFALGLGGRYGHGRQFVSWIHEQDLAALIQLAIADTSLSGPLNATAPAPVRNADFTRALAAALGRPALMHLPRPLLRALGELSDLFLASQRVVPERALRTGFRFRFARIEEAFDDLLA